MSFDTSVSRSDSSPKRKLNRTEARRLGRARRLDQRRKFFLDLKNLPGDACMTILEWATINSLSERQARRVLASDDGPVVTHLSVKRRAVTVRHNREWLERRAAR
jgi:hypothetical protein